MNTLLAPDDDDEEKKVADYYRDNYLCLGPLKLPITQELRPFWRIGVNAALAMQGRRSGIAARDAASRSSMCRAFSSMWGHFGRDTRCAIRGTASRPK